MLRHINICLLLAALLPATAWAMEYRSVSAPKAVLYDAPSAQARKLSIVTEGYPVEIIVNLGAWIKVRDVQGGLAWIEASQVSDKRTLVVTVAEARVYESASLSARTVFRAVKNVALDLLEPVPGGWVKVRHRDGLAGYIQTSEVWGL